MLWYLLAMTTFTGIVLQRISGTGFSMTLIPFLSLAVGPVQAVMLANIMSLPACFFILLPMRRDVDLKRTLSISFGAILGLLLGAYLVMLLPAAAVQLFLGFVMALSLSLSAFFNPKMEARKEGLWPRIACGLGAGFLNSSSGIPAPAMVIYARAVDWPHVSFVASLQAIFLFLNIGSLWTKLRLGLPYPRELFQGASLWGLLAVCVMAVLLGEKLAPYVPAEKGQALAFWVAFGGAVLAMSQAAFMLLSS